MSRKVTVNNEHKSLLLQYKRKLLKETFFDDYAANAL